MLLGPVPGFFSALFGFLFKFSSVIPGTMHKTTAIMQQYNELSNI